MKAIIAVIIIVIIGIGGYALLNQNKSTPKDSMLAPSEVKDEVGMKKDDKMMEGGKNYREYQTGILNENTNKKRVLFFYASWCPTCIPTDADFKKNTSMIPNDVEIIRVNYNDPETDGEEKALAAKYGVTYQHTFVQIDENGQEITKWNGGMIEELLGNVK